MRVDQAMNSSRSFHKAFQRAMEARQLDDDNLEILMVPGIVCVAFAIELGIKALVLRQESQISGHKLDDLFYKLKPSEQRALICALDISDSDFEHELTAAASVFVKWRYIYEATDSVSANLDFLRRLSEAIQNQLRNGFCDQVTE